MSFKFEINPIPDAKGYDQEGLHQLVQLYETCRIERTAQAEYCVRLEDRIVDYMVERKWLVDCVQHIYEHVQLEVARVNWRSDDFTIPCEDIHSRIKEYVK